MIAGLLALVGASGVASADTEVFGLMDGDRTWTTLGSPFVVTDDLFVGNGATLTIEPGVVVEFESNVSLFIGDADFGPGTLVARGTAAQPIRFQGAEFNPGPGSWRNIRFDQLAVSATFDGPDGPYVGGSVMEHCEIRHAGGGSSSGNGFALGLAGSPWLHEVDVRDCLDRGILGGLDGSPPLRIEACTVVGLNGVGIGIFGGENHLISECLVEHCAADDGAGMRLRAPGIRVIDNRIRHNVAGDLGGGIWIEQSEGAIVEGNLFSGNLADRGGGLAIQDSPGLLVRNNTIQGNTATAAGGGVFIDGGGDVRDNEILENVILDNTADQGGGFFVAGEAWTLSGNLVAGNRALAGDGGGGRIVGSSDPGRRFVSGNRFEHNRAEMGDGGGLRIQAFDASLADNHFQSNVAVRGGGCFSNSDGVMFQNDVFRRNRAATLGGGLFVDADGVIATDVQLIENSAGEAGGGVHWDGRDGSLASSGDGGKGAPSTRIHDNEAPIGSAIHLLGIFSSTGLGSLDASFVDWGTEDPDEIQAGIDDFFDDTTQFMVVTTPAPPGLIIEDEIWTRAGGPYLGVSSIVVGGGATWTIEPGTEIRMAPQSRILIGLTEFGSGAVVAGGTAEEPIVFTADLPEGERSPGAWAGFFFLRFTIDAFFDSDGVYRSGSILNHCTVEFAGGGDATQAAITIIRSRPHVVDSIVRDSARGGLFADPEANRLRIRRTRFERCHGVLPGGGVHVDSAAMHEIEGCVFVDCVAPQGGAVFVAGPEARLVGNRFQDNLADGSNGQPALGGAVFVEGTGARILGNQFQDNLADGSDGEPSRGGGLFLRSQTGLVQGNGFIGNTADVGGGLATETGFFLAIEDNTFLGNVGGLGGGMDIASTTTFVRRNVLIGNTAVEDGGGLRATGTGVRLDQNRFERNVAESGDGGGAAIDSPNAQIDATEFHGNIAGGTGGGGWISCPGGAVQDILAIGNMAEIGGGLAIVNPGSQPLAVRQGRVRENTAVTRGGGVDIDGTDVQLEELAVIANIAATGGGIHWTGGGAILSSARFPTSILDNRGDAGSQLAYVGPAGQILPATLVCWGSDDESVIAAGIADGSDGSGGGVVEVLPFLPGESCVRPPCPADLDADSLVDLTDLLLVLGSFGSGDGEGDVTGDGAVDLDDVIAVLAEWGRCP